MPVRPSLPGVAQAPWGLKVVALEHPKLWGGMLDLAPEATEDEATKLLAEIDDSQEREQSRLPGWTALCRPLGAEATARIPIDVRSDGTYLITGGLALGLRVARWMVEQGSPTIECTGRREVSSQAQETWSQLEAGAKVLVCSRRCLMKDMVRVLEKVKASMSPLRGVVHAAGVLDDGILLQQDWERFTGNGPKGKRLESAYIDPEAATDFFVVFSSAASLLGSPSQGNYAAANAFMDVLAHYRLSLDCQD